MAEQATPAKKRQRSPSYPAIGLEEAIQRARTLYEAEGRSPAPVNAILSDWDYSPGSGAGLVIVAALKKFGLLTDEGSGKQRTGRLTNLALQVILDDREESPERDDAIRQAALQPSIHAELWEKYGPELRASDATLRHFLRLERSFTDAAADDLIKEFRATVAFAKLGTSDSLSTPNEDEYPNVPPVVSVATPERETVKGAAPSGRQKAVHLPLSANEWITLQGAFPLSEEEWQQLLRVLEVMKPGLVAAAVPGNDDEPS